MVRTTCTKRSSKSTMPPNMMTAPWWGSMVVGRGGGAWWWGVVVGHGGGVAQMGRPCHCLRVVLLLLLLLLAAKYKQLTGYLCTLHLVDSGPHLH